MQYAFNPLEDGQKINRALYAKPKDTKMLIGVVCHRSNAQRQEILNAYFQYYNKSLMDELKDHLKGDFEEAMMTLFYSPVDFDCYHLNKAMKGLGTDEDTLIEILATRSNERINQLQSRYIELYRKDLVKTVNSKTSGFFRTVLLKLLEANRSNNPCPDQKECNDCAKRLYFSTQKKELLNDVFLYIFTQKSREELALIAQVYLNGIQKLYLKLSKLILVEMHKKF